MALVVGVDSSTPSTKALLIDAETLEAGPPYASAARYFATAPHPPRRGSNDH